MKLELYGYAVLTVNLESKKLFAGDVVLVIDFLKGNNSLIDAYLVESFNVSGETFAVFTVPANHLQALSENTVFHVREIVKNTT